jgi:hypothetical protein
MERGTMTQRAPFVLLAAALLSTLALPSAAASGDVSGIFQCKTQWEYNMAHVWVPQPWEIILGQVAGYTGAMVGCMIDQILPHPV